MGALSTPINELTWTDVETFCQLQVTEGASLDYKQAFPKKLECTITAMANTLGGTIFVGIADNDGKPVLPLTGVEFERGLAEKVLSISADNISPPIIPSVQVCPNAAGDRAIVVIKVPQSRDAPHAIDSNTQVYVRTGQRNDPDALANLERIQWMLGNRKAAEQFREWLITRADRRFDIASAGEVPHIARSQGFQPNKLKLNLYELPCVLTVLLVPSYPHAEFLMLPGQFQGAIREIAVPDPMNTMSLRHFPFLEVRSRLVEDGAIIHFGEGERTYHTHLNMHGLYFHKQSMLYPLVNKNDQTTTLVIRSAEIIRRTRTMIDSGAKLYAQLKYFGPLHARIRLERILGSPLLITEKTGERHTRFPVDPEIDATVLSSTDDLSSDANGLTHRLVRRIGWAFDWDFSEAEMHEPL